MEPMAETRNRSARAIAEQLLHQGQFGLFAGHVRFCLFELASEALGNIFASMQPATTLEQSHGPVIIRAVNRVAEKLSRQGIRRSFPTAAELIDIARRTTGLDDFGPGDFFEPLSRLLESCQREARLNLIGKLALRSDLIRTLSNRLLLQRDRHLFPSVRREPISQPLFIVGLPRSGTTLLHTLLSVDQAHRAPLVWEVMFPSPPTPERMERRIRETRRSLKYLHWLAPTFRQVHALGAELPQECIGLTSPSILSDQFDTMYRVPSYRAWFLKQDLLPAYEFHHRFLQHLQTRRAASRWVLKAPAHMFALPALLKMYPDALFVQVHREPLKAVASVSSLIAILRSVFSQHVDPAEVGRDAMQYWSETMTNFLQQRDELPAQRFCDVNYFGIRRDPVAVARQVYDHFQWELTPETEGKMRAVLANQPPEERGFHRYEPTQFGLSASEVAASFNGYTERFGLTATSAGSEPAIPRATAAG
jgi:sulfotransferase family protein